MSLCFFAAKTFDSSFFGKDCLAPEPKMCQNKRFDRVAVMIVLLEGFSQQKGCWYFSACTSACQHKYRGRVVAEQARRFGHGTRTQDRAARSVCLRGKWCRRWLTSRPRHLHRPVRHMSQRHALSVQKKPKKHSAPDVKTWAVPPNPWRPWKTFQDNKVCSGAAYVSTDPLIILAWSWVDLIRPSLSQVEHSLHMRRSLLIACGFV